MVFKEFTSTDEYLDPELNNAAMCYYALRESLRTYYLDNSRASISQSPPGPLEKTFNRSESKPMPALVSARSALTSAQPLLIICSEKAIGTLCYGLRSGFQLIISDISDVR